ncbi:YraN family protein [Sneathiella glossodoripedis]|uniref:YraN family protein n=1 Tax=Sneathiella glossodoripedis TaxID=418853 RepID=UPI000470E6C7|nr:YraN family protein [Sneathiella glossodoripedis]
MTSASKNKRKFRKQRAYRRGLIAEKAALLFLLVKGYRLLQLRYKKPVGEVDLLLRKGKTLVAVEVKLRETEEAALLAIGNIQKRRIRNACAQYVTENPQFSSYDVRFDVVVITRFFKIPLHIENAW